jgi:hypothetical protein
MPGSVILLYVYTLVYSLYTLGEYYFVFPLVPMGVLAPRLHMLDGSARPLIDTRRNFLAHMSVESPLNISPNRT